MGYHFIIDSSLSGKYSNDDQLPAGAQPKIMDRHIEAAGSAAVGLVGLWIY